MTTHQLSAMAWAQLWQVTLMIALAGAVTAMCCRRRPHVAHAIWLLVLLKCLTPPLWSSPTGVFSWIAARHSPAASISTIKDLAALTHNAQARQPVSSIEKDEQAEAPAPAPQSTWSNRSSTPMADRQNTVPPSSSGSRTIDPQAVVLGLWALGTVMMGSCLMMRWRSLRRRILRSQVDAPAEVGILIAALRQSLGVTQSVRVVVVSDHIGPALFGIIRPIIVLPRPLLESTTPMQWRGIIAHELTHLRRRDHIIAAVQLLSLCIWWFHPLVWWMSRQINRTREWCCDEEVIARLGCPPEGYAQLLVDVLRQRSSVRSMMLAPAVSPVQVTAQRLRHIMGDASRFNRRAPVWVWAMVVFGALVVLPGAGLVVTNSAGADAKPNSSAKAAASQPRGTASAPATQPTAPATFAQIMDASRWAADLLEALRDRDENRVEKLTRLPAKSVMGFVYDEAQQDGAEPILRVFEVYASSVARLMVLQVGWIKKDDRLPMQPARPNSNATVIIACSTDGSGKSNVEKLVQELPPHKILARFAQPNSYPGLQLIDSATAALSVIPRIAETLDDNRSSPSQPNTRQQSATTRPASEQLRDGLRLLVAHDRRGARDTLTSIPADELTDADREVLGVALRYVINGGDMATEDSEINRRVASKFREPLPVKFDRNKLVTVVDYFRNVTEQNMFTNWAELAKIGIDGDTSVTLKEGQLPANAALQLVLSGLPNLPKVNPPTFAIIDGIVVISSLQDLNKTQDVRVYDVRDLLGATIDGKQVTVESLREDITTRVGLNEDWTTGPRMGTIRELQGNLIVRTIAMNQVMIAKVLDDMRSAQGKATRSPTTRPATAPTAPPATQANLDVPLIPEVSTLMELRRVAPVPISDELEVRLGLGGAGAEGGPWRVLYAMVGSRGGKKLIKAMHIKNQDDSDLILGPLQLKLGMRIEGLVKAKYDFAPPKIEATHWIYARVIPTAEPGDIPIEVTTREGKIVGQRVVKVSKVDPCIWAEFAEEGRPFIGLPDAKAAIPLIDSTQPVLGLHGDNHVLVIAGDFEASGFQVVERTGLPCEIPLPSEFAEMLSHENQMQQQVQNSRIDPLKLTLEDGLLVIRSGTPMRGWPDLDLLARWWVNGNAVTPPRSDGFRGISLGRMIERDGVREMKVKFRPPDFLGKLKPGDRLSLRVLYCPASHSQLPVTGSNHTGAGRHVGVGNMSPLTSNRLDFTVTQQMLAAIQPSEQSQPEQQAKQRAAPAMKKAPASDQTSPSLAAEARTKIDALGVRDDTWTYETSPMNWLKARRDHVAPQLIDGLSHRYPQSAAGCARLLEGAPDSPELRQALMRAAQREDEAAVPALLALRRFVTDDAVRSLLKLAVEDVKRVPKPLDRSCLADAIGDKARAVAILAPYMRKGDDVTSIRSAIEQVESIGGPDAIRELVALDDQQQWATWSQSRLALAKLDPKANGLTADQEQFLREAGRAGKLTTEGHRARQQTLAALNRDEVMPYVLRMLNMQRDSYAWHEVVAIMAIWKDRRTLPIIEEWLVAKSKLEFTLLAIYLAVEGGEESDKMVLRLITRPGNDEIEQASQAMLAIGAANIPLDRKVDLCRKARQAAGDRWPRIARNCLWLRDDPPVREIVNAIVATETNVVALGEELSAMQRFAGPAYADLASRSVKTLAEQIGSIRAYFSLVSRRSRNGRNTLHSPTRSPNAARR